MKAKVLFVCVENSCRSQMAEGFARKLGEKILEAWSAVSKPSGKVNETAAQMMKEKEIDLSYHKSKGLDDLPKVTWDYVITMGCGDACPTLPAKIRRDWALPDPKHMPLEEFRRIRDEIQNQVNSLIREIIEATKQKVQ